MKYVPITTYKAVRQYDSASVLPNKKGMGQETVKGKKLSFSLKTHSEYITSWYFTNISRHRSEQCTGIITLLNYGLWRKGLNTIQVY